MIVSDAQIRRNAEDWISVAELAHAIIPHECKARDEVEVRAMQMVEEGQLIYDSGLVKRAGRRVAEAGTVRERFLSIFADWISADEAANILVKDGMADDINKAHRKIYYYSRHGCLTVDGRGGGRLLKVASAKQDVTARSLEQVATDVIADANRLLSRAQELRELIRQAGEA